MLKYVTIPIIVTLHNIKICFTIITNNFISNTNEMYGAVYICMFVGIIN